MVLTYPPADRSADADVLHGRVVADPYRWLEDASLAEPWCEAQDALLAAWWAQGRRPALRATAARIVRDRLPGFVSAPVVVAGRAFAARRRPDEDLPVVTVDGRVLLDPAAMSEGHTATIGAWWPSWDGRLLAYTVADGGTEDYTLHVVDVETGAPVDEPVVCGRGPDLAWIGDGLFAYVRRLQDLPEDQWQFDRRVWVRRLGTPVEDDALVFGEGRDKTTYYGLWTSADGRWITVTAALGTAPRNDAYLGDLTDPRTPRWAVIQQGVDAHTSAEVGPDGRLYLVTTHDAPRGRIAVADVGSPSAWTPLVAEGDGVIEGIALTDDAIVVARTRDVVAVVDVHELGTGAHRGRLELPGLGSASVTSRPAGGEDVWVTYTDHVTPSHVLYAKTTAGPLAPWAEPPDGPPDGPPDDPPDDPPLNVVTEQVWVVSSDGTRLPMFVVARPSAAGPRPTVLYGYGGFDVSLTPAYSATIAAWVDAGGVWASANLRGGSEFGEAWHRAGMRESKQNVFDDFAACARALVDTGWTTVAQLGIYGGSNGGLLVGAAVTQHPELQAAVVCSAPLLDMVRYERFGLGVTWNDEYGTADDPTELGWLLGYSPYHHVAEGVDYPAILFTVFDSDTRVDPLHARKMCAAMQWATAGEAPVLLRRERDVGHADRSVGRSVALSADIIAFLADRLGLDMAATGP